MDRTRAAMSLSRSRKRPRHACTTAIQKISWKFSAISRRSFNMGTTPQFPSEPPKLTSLGKLAIVAFVAACIFGAWYLLSSRSTHSSASGQSSSSSSGGLFSGGSAVSIGVAYGTEKKNWLEWAVQQFANSRQGKNITVNLIPMGSLEGAHAILDSDQRINAWSPASSLYKEQFVQDWQVKHGGNPILKEDQ